MSAGQSDAPSAGRPHVGQLLVHLTRLFQTELFARINDAGLEDARLSHTHVTAYIKADGSRLTDLAAQARMTPPAMAEIVDDLQRLGIVERRPDPSDRRAKLITLTDGGWKAMRTGQAIIAQLEAEYAEIVGPEGFEAMCQAMQSIITAHPASDRAVDPGDGRV
jgi:DNA-binding MarR family transcriptional regulator